ncbi:lasso RiPP family leader peptide-containing protein [Actinomadura atramentaria]|nr:lasso RiPP family leader peptide-containing protein [Actinomadura atramentaria]
MQAYEPPALVEIGDLREVTLGKGTWGWDNANQCLWLHCV